MKILKILLVLILVLTAFISCKSDDDNTSDNDSVGLIIGLDKAECACCGNWIIQIDNEQDSHQFLELPDNSGIDLNNVVFPISVNLKWTESDGNCNFVIISEINMN